MLLFGTHCAALGLYQAVVCVSLAWVLTQGQYRKIHTKLDSTIHLIY